jgi:hypothetical protein
MPTKYVLPAISGDHKDAKPTRIQTTIIAKLDKLQEFRLEAQKNVGKNQWNTFVESIETHRENFPIWKLCYLVSQGRKDTFGKIQEKMVWFIQGTILLTQ